MLHVEIDPRAPEPPSEQIAARVRFAIAAGRLVEGERLPSVRRIAADALVNPNTVSKAWRELEREGVLVARSGLGMDVAPGAPALCRAARDRLLRERMARLVAEALAAGLAPAAIEALCAAACEREEPQRRAG